MNIKLRLLPLAMRTRLTWQRLMALGFEFSGMFGQMFPLVSHKQGLPMVSRFRWILVEVY